MEQCNPLKLKKKRNILQKCILPPRFPLICSEKSYISNIRKVIEICLILSSQYPKSLRILSNRPFNEQHHTCVPAGLVIIGKLSFYFTCKRAITFPP